MAVAAALAAYFAYALVRSSAAGGGPARQGVIATLEWLSPLAIQLLLALWLVALLVAARRRRRRSAAFAPSDLAWLAGVLLIAGLVRGFIVPFQHRVYYDEDVYVQAARGIAAEGRAVQATAAIVSEGDYRTLSGIYSKWPNGWPALLSLPFRLFGPSEEVAFAVTFTLSLLSIALVGVLARQLFPADRTWLFAAAAYAALPANALWGSTAAADPAAAALGTGVLVAFANLGKRPHSGSALLLAVTTAALAVQFRAESLLILIPAVLLLLLTADRAVVRAESAAWRRWCYGAALLLVLLVPHALHMGAISGEYDPSMGRGVGFGVQYILPNLAANARYFLSSPPMIGTTALALLGLLRGRRRAIPWVLALWFVLFFAVFVPYFVGSYRLPGLERYVLLCLAPYAILAGVGVEALLVWLARGTAALRPNAAREVCLPPAIAGLVAVGIVAAGALSTPGHMRQWDTPTQLLALEHDLLRDVSAELPQAAVVFFPVPSLFVNLGRSSAWSSPGVSRAMLRQLAVHSGGELYLYSGLLPWRDLPESQRLRDWLRLCGEHPAWTDTAAGQTLTLYKLCGLVVTVEP